MVMTVGPAVALRVALIENQYLLTILKPVGGGAVAIIAVEVFLCTQLDHRSRMNRPGTGQFVSLGQPDGFVVPIVNGLHHPEHTIDPGGNMRMVRIKNNKCLVSVGSQKLRIVEFN